MQDSADEMLKILEDHEDCPNTQTMIGQYEDCELCGLPSFCHEY